jgi:hypothetical protein
MKRIVIETSSALPFGAAYGDLASYASESGTVKSQAQLTCHCLCEV